MRPILILLLITHAIFAHDLDPLFLIDGHIDVRTGEWILQKEDAIYRSLKGKWQVCPHTYLILYGPDYTRVKVAETTGLLISYTQGKGNDFEIAIPPEVTNTSLGQIGARTNLNNQTLKRINKFTFILETPDRIKRIYKKDHHEGTNLHFLLEEERYDDGTIRTYSYDQSHHPYTINGKRIQAPPLDDLPTGRITTYRGKPITYAPNQTTFDRKVYSFTPDRHLACIQTFDRKGQLTSKIPYRYSGTGLLLQAGDHTYSYDERGNPIEEQIGSRKLTRTFDQEDRVISLIEENEEFTFKSSYTYSQGGSLSEVSIDDGKHLRVIAIEGSSDFPTAVVERGEDTLLKTTHYTYGEEVIWKETFNPDGTRCSARTITPSEIDKPWLDLYLVGTSLDEEGWEIEKNYLGQMIARRYFDKNGTLLRQENWEYNADQLVSKTDRHRLKATYRYNIRGEKIEETLHTQKGPLTTTFHCDNKGRIDQQTQGEIATYFIYDKKGQIIEQREETLDGELLTLNASPYPPSKPLTIPTSESAEIEKDPFGNIISLRAKDGSAHYTITYNTRDQPIEVIDHITGQKGIRKYDDLGNLISETLLNHLTLESERDLHGRRTALTLPDGTTIHYRWGKKFLREIQAISREGQFDHLHQFTNYNLSGFPICQRQITDFGEITLKADENSKISSIHSHFVDQTPDDPTPPYSHELDGLGRIATVTQQGQTITFTYDPWNRKMTKTIIEERPDPHCDPIHLTYLHDDTREIGAMNSYTEKLIELRLFSEMPINSKNQSATSISLGLTYSNPSLPPNSRASPSLSPQNNN